MIRMSQSAAACKTAKQPERGPRGDAIAVERTLAGERDAFRGLVERHSQQLFRLAYRMTGNEQDAEEVVQRLLRAYRNPGQFGSRANFGTWAYRIAANYAIDACAKNAARMRAAACRQLGGRARAGSLTWRSMSGQLQTG
jgi:DNA-directed RNA polymerase specialized sigma24 family protein